MQMMTRPRPTRADTTRQQLKSVAQRLFAVRGISAVGLREVASEADQRNTAAVIYHFGSKDDLLRELLVDGAVAIDMERQAILDIAEAAHDVEIRDVVDALVSPSLRLTTTPGQTETWFRFMANVMGERRSLFEDAIVGHYSDGYERCVAHIRRLLPSVTAAETDRRLVFAMLSLQAIFAAREAAIDSAGTASHPFWSRPDMSAGIAATVTTILTQPGP